jgi:acyl-CoA thioesterase
MRLIEFTDQGSVMEMEIIPDHKNIRGNVHGGAISGLVDSSCGTSIGPMLEQEETVVTLDLRVQFFKPVSSGLLTAQGRVLHNTNRHIITESEVRDREGDLVARGNTIHILVRSRKE